MLVYAYPSLQGLSVYFRNISDRKQAEQEREQLLTLLTQRNEELNRFVYVVSFHFTWPRQSKTSVYLNVSSDILQTESQDTRLASLDLSVYEHF